METIAERCKRLGISKPVYYKIAHRLKRHPSDEEILEHKKNHINGRPRKKSF